VKRPDHDLAAQVARNVQHANRLGQLYRTVREPELEPHALRQQLVEAAACAGPAAGSLSTPAQCEQYITRLRGLARLALQLRDSLRNSAAAKPGAASCPHSTEHGGSHDRK